VKVIVGLGNPGRKYEDTPHNVGFAVVDVLARKLGCRLRRSFRFAARVGKAVHEGESLFLLKPETYMNRSGAGVAPFVRYRKAERTDLILVVDDAALELGRIRIRARGSSGGHKGLASVLGALGTEEIARVRLGIGRGPQDESLVKRVLTPFSDAERDRMGGQIAAAAEAVLVVIGAGVEEAMNRYNG